MTQNIPIHVINLEHRTDRKIKLLEQFAKHNITNYTFVNAVYGDKLDIDEMLASGEINFSDRQLKNGEYGCYLSHLNIFRSILESSDELHLILEDDVYFVNGFNSKLDKLLKKLQDVEWDIFYLGVNSYSPECRKGTFVGNKIDGIYCPIDPPTGTHAYLIKKETVKKIIDLMSPIVLPIDILLVRLDLKRLTLINLIALVDNTDSDTQ